MGRLAAIHQPNFLPWLGFWDKVVRADVMVLLDDAQFPKKGGTWINRTQVVVNGEASWLTVPVGRSHSGTRTILETEIDESVPWRKKMTKTLQAAYGRAACFDEVISDVLPVIEYRGALAEMNIAGIRRLADHLGIGELKLVRSSELGVEGASTERLIAIAKAVGADAYLEGGGAAGYQEDEKFADAGIEVVKQGFEQPAYPQRGEDFVSGLSVVDALANLGFARTRELLGR